jgi:hypothetical protein
VAVLAVVVAGLWIAGVFAGGGEPWRPPSYKPGVGTGIPGLDSLDEVVAGVGVSALSRLRSRGPMDTIMQDDATFIYGASDEAVASALQRAEQLGVDRIRLTAAWSVLAPEADDDQEPSFDASDPGAYTRNGWKHYDPIGHWQALDRAVRATVATGMRPMIDIGFWAPKWATSGDPNASRRTYNVNPQQYAEFVKALVKRYSGSYVAKYGTPAPPAQSHSTDSDALHTLFGALGGQAAPGSRTEAAAPSSASAGPKLAGDPLPKVSTWTIWNEPNHAGFIQPQWRRQGSRLVPNGPYVYRALVDAAYPAIKGLQPDSTVLVGATSSMGNEHPSRETNGEAPLVFLRALACVDSKFRPVTSGPCANFRPLPATATRSIRTRCCTRPTGRTSATLTTR